MLGSKATISIAAKASAIYNHRMTFNRDLSSKRVLHFKGWLFLLLGTVAGILLLVDSFSLQKLALLIIAIWSFCRFYYFLFYVLENYAGRDRPYAGVLDAFLYLIHGEKTD